MILLTLVPITLSHNTEDGTPSRRDDDRCRRGSRKESQSSSTDRHHHSATSSIINAAAATKAEPTPTQKIQEDADIGFHHNRKSRRWPEIEPKPVNSTTISDEKPAPDVSAPRGKTMVEILSRIGEQALSSSNEQESLKPDKAGNQEGKCPVSVVLDLLDDSSGQRITGNGSDSKLQISLTTRELSPSCMDNAVTENSISASSSSMKVEWNRMPKWLDKFTKENYCRCTERQPFCELTPSGISDVEMKKKETSPFFVGTSPFSSSSSGMKVESKMTSMERGRPSSTAPSLTHLDVTRDPGKVLPLRRSRSCSEMRRRMVVTGWEVMVTTTNTKVTVIETAAPASQQVNKPSTSENLRGNDF